MEIPFFVRLALGMRMGGVCFQFPPGDPLVHTVAADAGNGIVGGGFHRLAGLVRRPDPAEKPAGVPAGTALYFHCGITLYAGGVDEV